MTEPARPLPPSSPFPVAKPAPIAPPTREDKLALLLTLTQIPTATGREQRVIAFVREWANARPDVALHGDGAGNLSIHLRPRNRAERKRRGRENYTSGEHAPLYITAHLDHPAFVVEKPCETGSGTFEVSFRGGVMDVFFDHAPIIVHTAEGPLEATLSGECSPPTPAGKHYRAELDAGPGGGPSVRIGDVARWKLPETHIDERGLLHTHACDDLAAAAAALCAMDELRSRRDKGEKFEEVRLLFTRGEEIGFLGAIAACKLGTMPRGSRVIALENSRSFVDSPIGGGPIVRVGDRLSVFTPWLTAACCARAEELFGGPSAPKASETTKQGPKRPWQRKLMAGGACEASVFCSAGYDATCICLPLGNYHNMPHLDALQAGTYDATLLGPPRCAPEYIHTNDYLSLIDLLVALALRLPGPDDATFATRLDTMFTEKKYTLGTINEPAPKKAPEPKKGKGPAKDAPAADEKPAERPRHFYPRTASRSRTGASRSGPPRSGPPRSGPPRSGPPRSGPSGPRPTGRPPRSGPGRGRPGDDGGRSGGRGSR